MAGAAVEWWSRGLPFQAPSIIYGRQPGMAVGRLPGNFCAPNRV